MNGHRAEKVQKGASYPGSVGKPASFSPLTGSGATFSLGPPASMARTASAPPPESPEDVAIEGGSVVAGSLADPLLPDLVRTPRTAATRDKSGVIGVSDSNISFFVPQKAMKLKSLFSLPRAPSSCNLALAKAVAAFELSNSPFLL